MASIRDHFNVLVVCALESELQAAKRVLEHGTDSRFEEKYLDLPGLRVHVCEGWNSTHLKVAMAAQTRRGGIYSQLLVSRLAKYFTANVVVMTGSCSGEEGTIEYGSVVIASRGSRGQRIGKRGFPVHSRYPRT